MIWNTVKSIRVFVIFLILIKVLQNQMDLFIRAFEQSQKPSLKIPSSTYQCEVAEWNRITLKQIPHAEDFKFWARINLGTLRNLLDAEARLLSAFVYHDQISMITTSQNIDGRPATCRYYDCERNEIANTLFHSIVAPMTVISCPRRYGAEFVSFNLTRADPPPEPIPLTFRIYEKPLHELAVCVGPLYGNESKWMELVEYAEHYKLIGASFFYFTLFNLNEYDRKIIDYYAKLGYAEYTTYFTEYETLGWMFHMIQTQECHHRSRYHSKWVLNVDIDERLVYSGHGNLLKYLRSMPPKIGELSFSTNRVIRTKGTPEQFRNFSRYNTEFMFKKFNKTTETSWYNMKGAIRPELVFVLFYHWSYQQEKGIHIMSVPKRIAHIRHYRYDDKNALNGNWIQNYTGNFKPTRLDSNFERSLLAAVKERIRYVYDRRTIRCEEIPKPFLRRFGRNLIDCEYKNEISKDISVKNVKPY